MSRMGEGNPEQQGGMSGGGTGTGQMRDAASQVQQNIRDMGNQVRDAAQEKFDQLRDQASEYYEQGRERAREWEQSLESYVQDQPLKSLLIAAGIGALIGFLYRRS